MLMLWLWLWLWLLYLIASAPVAIERKKAAMKNKHLKISPINRANKIRLYIFRLRELWNK